jgi:gtrA family protein
MIGAFRSRQFLVFLLTGGIAAAVNFGSRILYNQWMGFSAAIVLAYITGMVTAFVLARLFVFRNSQRALHQSALYFVLVNGVAVLQTWAISLLLADWLLPALGIRQYVHELAHAAGVVVPVFTSYLGHKHLSFK